MNVDVAALVEESMKVLGCEQAIEGKLDNHSTISIGFRDRPSLNISLQDEKVWLWATVGEYNPHVFAQRAPEILESQISGVFAPFPFGQPALAQAGQELELKAAVEPSYLENATKFSEALETFFDRLCAIHDLLTK